MDIQRFTLTKDHIKLLRNFYVGWQDCETGAPEIDTKRPYGNSDVWNDIHEILTGHCLPQFHDEIVERYLKLHRETEIALQIILSTGKFKAGTYESESWTNDWKLVK